MNEIITMSFRDFRTWDNDTSAMHIVATMREKGSRSCDLAPSKSEAETLLGDAKLELDSIVACKSFEVEVGENDRILVGGDSKYLYD